MFKHLLICFQKYDWGCTVYLVTDYEINIVQLVHTLTLSGKSA
jgi:hypothetical protein